MNKQNTYLAIARKAYKGILYMYGVGAENEFCSLAQKTAERYLKAVLETVDISDLSVMRAHSLRKIYKELKKVEYLGMELDIILRLDGYYITSVYPGPEYSEIDSEEERLCKETLDYIVKHVETYFQGLEDQTPELNIWK